jgi:hypothetical protein
VVPVLVKRVPDSLAMKSVAGLTPHHFAAGSTATVEMVEPLINGFRQAMTMLSRAGPTPLHLSCWNGSSPRIVQLLADRDPEAVEMVSNTAETVLHDACNGSEAESIRSLFNIWPVTALLRAAIDEEPAPQLPHGLDAEEERSPDCSSNQRYCLCHD